MSLPKVYARRCIATAIALSIFGSQPGFAQAERQAPFIESHMVFPSSSLELLGLKPVMTVPSGAADRPLDPASSVHDLVVEALIYSLEVQSGQLTSEAAGTSAEVARRALMPRIDATLSNGANLYRTTTQPNTSALFRTDATLVAKQSLWDYGARSEVKRRGSLHQASVADSTGTSLRVSADLISAYLEVVRNRATVDITNDYERTLKRLIDYLRKRTEAGASSQADLDRVRGREEGARSRGLEATAGLAAAGFALKRQLGRVPDQIAIPASIDLKLPGSAELAFSEASANSPELMSARAQLDALGHEYQALRGRFMPKVELELGNARSRNASGTRGATNDIKAMVVMSMSLYASGADDLEMKASAQKRSALHSRIQHAERVLRQDLDVAYSAIDAIHQRLAPAARELEANARVAKTYDEQLLLGGRSLLDLLDAYQRLYEARLGTLQLVILDAQQKYNVVRLLGRIDQLKSGG